MDNVAVPQDEQWPQELYNKLRLSNKRFSIRLIRLRPGKQNAPIQCEMFCTSLAGSPPYEALSYTWGVSKQHLRITVNKIDVPITPNLEYALRGLRHEGKDRLLWVDALCINQQRISERNAHVAEMGDIYNFAHRVVVWLQEAPIELPGVDPPKREDHEMALKHIRAHSCGDGSKATSHNTYALSSAQSHAVKRTIERFLHARWFTRVWVVQEMARPRQDPLLYIYNGLTLSWSELVAFVKISDSKGYSCCENAFAIDGSSIETLDYIRNLMQVPPALREFPPEIYGAERRDVNRSLVKDLLELLSRTDSFEASDPRDKIFGLWALARGGYGHKLRPDYNKSIADVYCAVTKAIIEEVGDLRIIFNPSLQTRHERMPSWVPDYSLPMPFLEGMCGPTLIHRAMTGGPLSTTKSLSFESNDTILRISGWSLGFVVSYMPMNGATIAAFLAEKGAMLSLLPFVSQAENFIAETNRMDDSKVPLDPSSFLMKQFLSSRMYSLCITLTSLGFVGISRTSEVLKNYGPTTELFRLEQTTTVSLLQQLPSNDGESDMRKFKFQGNVLVSPGTFDAGGWPYGSHLRKESWDDFQARLDNCSTKIETILLV